VGTGTSPRVELTAELPDDRAQAPRESPKLSNDSDEVPESPPWEDSGDVDWTVALDQEFPRVNEPEMAAATAETAPPENEDAFILRRLGEEGISSSSPPPPPPSSPTPIPSPPRASGPGSGNGRDPYSGNGARPIGGSKSAAAADSYTEEHTDEPFDDNFLRAKGYALTQVYNYTLADGAPLYQQNRYELDRRVAPTKKRPRKRFLAHRKVNGKDVFGAGDRLVPYNWPAIMRAGPGSTIFVPEGENKAKALIDAGLLATTVLSHKWTPECVAALTGCHVIILEDNDKEGKQIASNTQKRLAPIAASTRIVSAVHMWKHLPGRVEPKPHDDVVNWIALGGDPKKLLDICREIPVEGTLESVCAADVEIEDYDWVWPGRLALKKIALIVGLPDEGKGLVISDIMARITRGSESWPCGEGCAPLGNVIVLTAEDDINDTIVPRLMAAGADLKRVTIIKMVHEAGKERMFSLITDLAVLRQKIIEIGNVTMVLIDPISAYLGIGKIDSFRATDVRAVLGPLKMLAEELRVSILGIMHFNKKIDVTNVMLRISDSHAYGAASRHVYAVIDDPDNHRKLFVKGKNNMAQREQKTLAFGIDTREVGTDKRTRKPIHRPYIIWHDEPVDITATEALRAVSESKSPSERDHTKHFLEALLSNGPINANDVHEAAKENGISLATLRRAKKDLGDRIEIKKDGPPNEKNEITWRWHLVSKQENNDD
jgi:hypothetical protein